jgi:predicted regulator of Ras-like GTPase activity (Roadblock/LC7/MglB family)
MDAASALADLLEISSQIEAAVLLAGDGSLVASTLAPEADSGRLARAGREVLEAAEARLGGGRAITQVEVSLREGSLFVVREAGRTIVGRSRPKPSSQLVLYDLKACLRAAEPPTPKRRPARKKVQAAGDA